MGILQYLPSFTPVHSLPPYLPVPYLPVPYLPVPYLPVPELDVTKSHSEITKIEKSVSLKFGCKDIEIGKLEFEARTQFR